MDRVLRRVCCCLFIALASGSSFAAQPLDDFESPQASWRAGDADVAYRLEAQQRVRGGAHSGQGFERLQISAGAGSFVYFSHDVSPARIATELCPSVWVKSSRPGIQLLAIVVLPHTPDPRTGTPITTLIRGDTYADSSQWQKLSLADTPRLLNRQLRVLRNQMNGTVDAREAYIDKIVLNVFAGPGQTIVDIDDLELTGVVPYDGPQAPTATQSKAVLANNAATRPRRSEAIDRDVKPAAAFTAPATTGPALRKVGLTGSVLMVDSRPMFPRMVRWQGEPLTWLKEAGFNTVRVGGQLTLELLAEANRLGISLVGPPPEQGNTITVEYEPVLAWHLGDRLTSHELTAKADLARQIRRTDSLLKRPLVCSADEDLLAYSRQTDVLSAFRFPLGTSIELKDHGAWLRERPRLARPGTPLWTIVQTEMAPAVTEQATVLTGTPTAPAVDPDSLRVLAYQAFCSGARGIEFASENRLDQNDINTRIRAAALALLNLELDLIEPWGAAGNYAANAISNDPAVTAVVLNVENAKLVIAMRSPKNSQFVGAPEAGGTSLPSLPGVTPMRAGRKSSTADDPRVPQLGNQRPMQSSAKLGQQSGGSAEPAAELSLDRAQQEGAGGPAVTTLTVPGIPDGHSVYELTPVEIRPLRYRRVAGGTAIAMEDFSLVSLVLVTPDPLVKSAMSRKIAENAPRAARLQRELSALVFMQLESISRRFIGQTQLPPATGSFNAARADLARADQLLAAGDNTGAFFASRSALLPLGRWKRETWLRVVSTLGSSIASPLAVSFSTLPEHLRFMASVRSPAGENALAGGEAEDLNRMLQAGWRHFQHPQNDVQTSVELSPLAPFNGKSSLRMQARSTKPDAAATVIESPPLWISSAPVRVAAGDIVCIRGQVRVPTAITGSVDGLMILDSLGGEALAERIGQTSGWREFVLYRAAPRNDNLTISFAVTGLGEAWIDDVSVQFLRRGSSAPPMAGQYGAAEIPPAEPENSAAFGQSGPLFAPPALR